MKINIVGTAAGHSRRLSEYLWNYGTPNVMGGLPYTASDVTFVPGLMYMKKEMFAEGNPPVVGFAMGRDVFDGWNENKSELLRKCVLVLYAHKRAMKITGVPGVQWQIPYDNMIFNEAVAIWKREQLELQYPGYLRDTLIYCPNVDKYRVDAVFNYIENNPDETFTVMGCPSMLLLACPENTELISYTYNLPFLMSCHKKLMFWITESNMPDHPKINVIGCEALAMGLKVYVNEKQYYYLPNYMQTEVAMPRLINLIKKHI